GRARARGIQNDLDLLAAGQYSQLLKYAENWQAPQFPLHGRDLVALGAAADERLGKALAILKDEWVSSGFTIDREALVERARDLLALKS
ncbi:MAG: CCA tRNA nucleotidyltransferase, partial [Aliihoeflea sp.]